MGGSALIAQYKGAKDEKSQKEAVGTIYTVTAVAALLIKDGRFVLAAHHEAKPKK